MERKWAASEQERVWPLEGADAGAPQNYDLLALAKAPVAASKVASPEAQLELKLMASCSPACFMGE